MVERYAAVSARRIVVAIREMTSHRRSKSRLEPRFERAANAVA
jgi:hypothetical protein